ncbi:MAG: hypothetical protein D6800_06330, partial [Candidatus Zixiibacteriota bacterium]
MTLPPQKVQGQPLRAAHLLLKQLFDMVPPDATVTLSLTGSQSKLAATLLGTTPINEFKAIARGVVEIVPDARTILEIGGDGSRFIKIDHDQE